MDTATLQKNSTKLENFDATIGILTGGNANYRQGVHWIIQDIGQETAFANKTLAMELAVENARETFSFIDVVCKNCSKVGTDLLIEYKSGPGSITSSTIKKQFIERDLFKANSLDEIQWRMKNTSLTKDKLVDWLTENRSDIEKLGVEKVKKFFPQQAVQINESNFVDFFINKFKQDNIYDKIFK